MKRIASALVVAAILITSGCASRTSFSVSNRQQPTGTESLPTPVPTLGDSVEEIQQNIERAYGSRLETVSVEGTSFVGFEDDAGDTITGFRISYALIGCPTRVTTFMSDADEPGIVPPYNINWLDENHPNRDRMSAARFLELLKAYGRHSSRPCGGVRSYASAAVADDTFIKVAGVDYRTSDLWVVAPGFDSQAELKGIDPFLLPGYVFSYPLGASPRFLRIEPEIGLGPDLGD